MTTFNEIVDEAEQLKSAYVGRTELFDEMEAMYFLDPKEKSQLSRMADNVKLTISPDAANQIDGAVRLMVGSDPNFSVDKDIPNRDEIEEFARAMWDGSGQVSGTPAHYDPILSGLLYGEAHMGIISMRKLAQFSKGKPTGKLAEQALALTPYLFETWSPRSCYAQRGRLGLTAHYREIDTTARQVRHDWGELADKALGQKGDKDPVTYCEWWDAENQAAWIQGLSQPILFEPHELSFIPIVHSVTEGSTGLFSKTSQQLRPFLYKVAKSGLWNRDNMLMTVFFTMVFAIGANPMFKFVSPDDRDLPVDYSKPGGIVRIRPGESYEALTKQVIDPSIMQGKQIIDEKITDSTMYKQALGQPLSGNSPYSLVALLSQSGRLPLISPQRRLRWMISRAVWTAFMWMREEGKATARYRRKLEFDPNVLPDDFDIDVQLDIRMPQDQLGLANVANLLVQTGLVSKEWIRANVLNIGNDTKMTKEVYKERFLELLGEFVSAQLIESEQQQQQVPPAAPGNLPPEMMAGGMQGPEQLPMEGQIPEGQLLMEGMQ